MGGEIVLLQMMMIVAARRLELLRANLREIQFDLVTERHHRILVQFIQSAHVPETDSRTNRQSVPGFLPACTMTVLPAPTP